MSHLQCAHLSILPSASPRLLTWNKVDPLPSFVRSQRSRTPPTQPRRTRPPRRSTPLRRTAASPRRDEATMWATRGRAPRSERWGNGDDEGGRKEQERASACVHSLYDSVYSRAACCASPCALSGSTKREEARERTTRYCIVHCSMYRKDSPARPASSSSELDRPDPRPGHDPPPLGRRRPALLRGCPMPVAERLLDVLRESAVEAVPVRVRQLVLGAARVGVQMRDGLARLGVDLASEVVDEALRTARESVRASQGRVESAR